MIPDADFEGNHPAEADAAYEAWARYLRSKTRDNKKYSLLFTENINYGYRRNLWGLKNYAISLLVVLVVATYGYNGFTNKTFNPVGFPISFTIAEIIMFIVILLWFSKVKTRWVKIPAEVYAERLLETTENLKVETVKKDKTTPTPQPKKEKDLNKNQTK